MTREVVYFAHSMRDYGTPVAVEAKRDITRLLPDTEILDPEELDWNGLTRQLGSCEAVYDHVVARSHRIAVLEHAQHIGRGVFEEASRGLRSRKPVHVLRDHQLVPVERVAVVDKNDWKVRYGRIVTSSGKGKA